MIVQVRHPRLYSRFTMRRLFSFSFIISELALDVSESQYVAEKEGRRAGRGGGGGRFRTKHRGSSAYIMTAEAKAGAVKRIGARPCCQNVYIQAKAGKGEHLIRFWQ